MVDCSHIKADWAKLEQMAAIFKSPSSFAYHVGKDLIINHADIYHEVSAAIKDYDQKLWFDFGYQVGEAAAKTILGDEHKLRLRNERQGEQIVAGFLKGTLNAEGFKDIKTCIKDIQTVVGDAKIIAGDFEKKDIADIIAGLKEVTVLAKDVKQGMQDCSHKKVDWNKFDTMIESMENPESFAFHIGKDLIVNGQDIKSEIELAVEDYRSEKYVDFGFNLGQAMSKTFVGKSFENQKKSFEKKSEIAQVMQGVTKAYGGHFSLDALLACIGDEDKAAIILDEAYLQF
jgi:hypothetical protein